MIRKALLAIAAFLLAAAAPADQPPPLKVAFVYVGSVHGHGWTPRHDQGRQAVEDQFGERVETSFIENVRHLADARRVIEQLARLGHDLIFTTSFGFMDPTLSAARQFRDVKFEHAQGYKRSANVATYAARFYQGRYIAGQIAGRMTRSQKIGYIASFPIPEVIRDINAAALGARSVNRRATVRVVWVNAWRDPDAEAEAAERLIADGADIIMQQTDSAAPLKAAEEAGIHAFGEGSDMIDIAPNAQLTAIIHDWTNYYTGRVWSALVGKWESSDVWPGLAEGAVRMAPYTNMPAEVRAAARRTEQAIRTNAVHPFTGPIADRTGQIRIAEGETATDAQLRGMAWFVEGVSGDLPN